jgi:hypothetical protein
MSRYACPRLSREGIMRGQMNRSGAVLLLVACAVIDFAFGYFKWHTMDAAVTAVVCGLPLGGFPFF